MARQTAISGRKFPGSASTSASSQYGIQSQWLSYCIGNTHSWKVKELLQEVSSVAGEYCSEELSCGQQVALWL